MTRCYLGWTIREQGNSWIGEKKQPHAPEAPKLISGTLEAVGRRLRIYEGCATEEDLRLPV